jgi:hypothetical protein
MYPSDHEACIKRPTPGAATIARSAYPSGADASPAPAAAADNPAPPVAAAAGVSSSDAGERVVDADLVDANVRTCASVQECLPNLG